MKFCILTYSCTFQYILVVQSLKSENRNPSQMHYTEGKLFLLFSTLDEMAQVELEVRSNSNINLFHFQASTRKKRFQDDSVERMVETNVLSPLR